MGTGWEAKKTSTEGAEILSRVARTLLSQEGNLAGPLDQDQDQNCRAQEGCGAISRSETVRLVLRSCCSREQLGTASSLRMGTMSHSSL